MRSAAPVAPSPRRILASWWPLAASWMLMGAELPLLTAVVSRLPDPERHLAAYGSLVFPIAVTIEAPIIMLLAASTALCGDWASYVRVRRFMHGAGAALTALHLLVAFTPAFDVAASGWIGAPPEVIEPARLGLRLMTPWTWSIAYRRFLQGVLIRFDRSRAVGAGTGVRLLANGVVLATLAWDGRAPGIAVAACAVSAGVIAEAAFIGAVARRTLRERVRPAPAPAVPLTGPGFLRFYAPLAMTPLVTLLAQPIGAAAMSRLPLALESLATWPAYHGLVFLFRALGLAYNEVVVALIGAPGAARELARFTWKLAAATVAALALVALPPLADAWFSGWSHLEPRHAELGRSALLFALLLPGLNVLQSFHQGVLVHRRRTRAISEAVAVSLATTAAGLALCVAFLDVPGLPAAAAMLTLGNLVQTLWLRRAARPILGDPLDRCSGSDSSNRRIP
jgi:hypothetical protein